MAIFKKAKKPAAKAPKPVSKPKSVADKVRAKYVSGVNHQALADEFDLTVAEVTDLIGA